MIKNILLVHVIFEAKCKCLLLKNYSGHSKIVVRAFVKMTKKDDLPQYQIVKHRLHLSSVDRYRMFHQAQTCIIIFMHYAPVDDYRI